MTATAVDVVITEPGLYDLPADVYHSDPVPGGSLSQSGAKKLLPPGCPALYRYWADHPQDHKRAFDFGHAAHREVLGIGPGLTVIDAADWRTKGAREKRDEAYAAGLVPLLAEEHDAVQDMAAALREHPFASALFTNGRPEQSMFWLDGDVMRRAMLDWLPDSNGGRVVVPDYKTCVSAEPRKLQKTIADYGYHQQGDWYLDGLRALGLADDTAVFLLVFQEKTPPYLVTVAQVDVTALRIGRHLNRAAIDLYARCVAADRWPGYSDEVEVVSLPSYIENQYLEVIQP